MTTNGIPDGTNGIHAGSPLADVLDELRYYSDDLRYDYNPLDDVFEPDERLSELCGEVADMLEAKRDAPEGDALSIMRDKPVVEICKMFGIDPNGRKHVNAMLGNLADMVERDYVSREEYEDLRDEFTWTNTFLHRMGKKCGTKDVPSLKAYVEQLESKVEELEAVDRNIAETDSRWEAAIRDLECMTTERDELKKQMDTMRDVVREFRDERDEWKAECSKLTDKIGEITDEGSELMKKQPYTFDVHDVPGSLQTVGRYIDELTAERDELDAFAKRLECAAHDKLGVTLFGVNYVTEGLMLHVRYTNKSIIEALESHNRELKARAEGFTEALEKLGCSVLANGTVFGPTEAKSAKRVAAVKRLKDARYHTLADYVRAMLGWGHEPHFEDCRDALIDLLEDDGVERSRTEYSGKENDPETPDSAENPQKTPECMQKDNEFADCGHIADMSRKDGGCVRNDDFPSEVGVRAADVDANDANATQDCREKLEADVRKHYSHTVSTLLFPPSANKSVDMLMSLPVDTVLGWLDRQAAITKGEWCAERGWWDSAEECNRATALCHEKDERIAELQAEIDKRDRGIARLKRQRDEARAERDMWRMRCGELLDAAHGMQGIADVWEDE